MSQAIIELREKIVTLEAQLDETLMYIEEMRQEKIEIPYDVSGPLSRAAEEIARARRCATVAKKLTKDA